MLKEILKDKGNMTIGKKRPKWVNADLEITERKIAKIIMQWSDHEKKPLEFFVQCLRRMGIITPVRIMQLVKLPNYYMVTVRESESGVLRNFYISKNPKELLMTKVLFDDENVIYIVQGNEYKLLIREGNITVEYFQERIRVSVDNMMNDIDITLTGYDWNNEEESLYAKAKSLIADLQTINKNLEPYSYYAAAKEKIAKYYNLRNVAIGFYTNFLTIHSCDGKLLVYQDSKNGITIKTLEPYVYKEYCADGIKMVWNDGKFKCEGVPDKDIPKYMEVVEIVLAEVEKLEF